MPVLSTFVLGIAGLLLAAAIFYIGVRYGVGRERKRLAAGAAVTQADGVLPPADQTVERQPFKLWVQRQVGAQVGWRSVALEWTLLVAVVLTFCLGFLDLGTRNPLSGTEAEIFQSLDWVLVNSLQHYGQFPLWNPYILTGMPYVADPFLHLYNPLVTVPVLVMGVWDGFKVGLFLTFVAAALGGWYLGKVMGVGALARLWLGLSYAFTGRAAAQFLQGQYDLIFSFAWVPLCIAGFIAVTQTRRPFHIGLTALSLALLFVSGNVYYTYYMLFVLGLFGLVAIVTFQREPLQVGVDWRSLRVLLMAGVLAIAIAAIQVLPEAQLWSHLDKTGDPALQTSHTLGQIWLDYTDANPDRPDTHVDPQETYSYIGLIPFLGLLLLPLAWRRYSRRVIVFMLLLFLLTLVWTDIRDTPLSGLYERLTILNQFRYPTRFLLLGAVALLSLSALEFDSVLQWARVKLQGQNLQKWNGQTVGAAVLLAAVVLVMLYAVCDVYSANRQLAITFRPYELAYDAVSALKQHDPSPGYVSTRYLWTGAFISNEVRDLGMFYGYTIGRSRQDSFSHREVEAKASYVIQADTEPRPAPDDQVALRAQGFNFYKQPASLPFAFVAQDAVLQDTNSGDLTGADVTALKPTTSTPNLLQFQADGAAGTTLVVLTPLYDGWSVAVDGVQQSLRNVDGWLGVPLMVGTHTYTFSFDSLPFKLGMIISFIALVFTVGMMAADTLQVPLPRLSALTRAAVL